MSFFTGFVTGLAGSVDKQLQASIERTRENIDMVSKWRLKKAEEREVARKKKDQEIETLIKDAAYVIGGNANDVSAQNIAAALYKERGLSGFTDDISFMKKQKESSGVNPLQYITRAQTDLPENKYGLSQIVRSLSDAELSYLPSGTAFPKDIIKGGGLIKTLAPDFDIMGAGQKQADEQMDKMGLTTKPATTSLDFGRYSFDREALNYHSMDTNAKLTHLRDIIVNPSSTEEQVKKAEDRRDKLLQMAVDQGDDDTQLKALDQRLSLMNPDDKGYDDVLTQRRSVSRKIKLEQAELEGNEAVLRARADFAAQDGNVEEATRLSREADDLKAGGVVSFETQISRMDDDIQRKLKTGGAAYKNSEGPYAGKGMAEDIMTRNAVKTQLENLKGATESGVNQAYNNIYSIAKKNLALQNPKLASALEGLSLVGASGEIASSELGKILKLLKDSGKDATKEFQAAIASAIRTSKDQAIKQGWNTQNIDLAAERFGGIDLSAVITATSTAASATVSGGTPAPAGLGGDTPAAGDASKPSTAVGTVVGGTGVDQDAVNKKAKETKVAATILNDMRADFPVNDPAKFVSSSIREGDDNNTIAANARLLYPDNETFASRVSSLLSAEARDKASTELTNAGYDGTGMLKPEQRQIAVANLVEALDVDPSSANYLIDAVYNKAIGAVDADYQAKVSEVRSALDRRNIRGVMGSIPSYRMNEMVKFVTARFNVGEEEARKLINDAVYPATDTISAEDVETIGLGNAAPKDFSFGDLGKDFDDGIRADEVETISADVPPEPASTGESRGEEVDLSAEFPDVIFRSMGKAIQYKKVGDDFYRIKKDGTLAANPVDAARKSILENPNRRDVTYTGGVDDLTGNAPARPASESITKPSDADMADIDVKTMPHKDLIKRYIARDMSDAMVAEIRSRLQNDDKFVDQIAKAIANAQAAAAKAKRTIDADALASQKQRIKKQGAMARGGLMRR